MLELEEISNYFKENNIKITKQVCEDTGLSFPTISEFIKDPNKRVNVAYSTVKALSDYVMEQKINEL